MRQVESLSFDLFLFLPRINQHDAPDGSALKVQF
jgi:hypothetical protein